MKLWEYILTPAGPSLGPVATLTIIASVFVALGGIALVVVPKELAHLSAMRSTRQVRAGHSETGSKERQLRAELPRCCCACWVRADWKPVSSPRSSSWPCPCWRAISSCIASSSTRATSQWAAASMPTRHTTESRRRAKRPASGQPGEKKSASCPSRLCSRHCLCPSPTTS